MRLHTTTFAFLLAAGCAAQSPSPDAHIIPPGAGIRGVSHVPAGMGAVPFDDGDGGFTFTGPTAPGSATFTNANVGDNGGMPTGSGSIDVTISGTEYTSSAFQTMTMIGLTDDNGDTYVALAGYYLYDSDQDATQLFVIVKQADFELGTPIAFDGVDRVAIFGAGLVNAEQPSVTGAAVSGSVTFTSGSLTEGDTVDATVSGDFGPIQWVDGGMGSGSGSGTGAIVAGSYTLAYQGPVEVDCTGALVGHEADFSSISMTDLGFAGGAVSVTTPSPSATDVDGTVIASAFGTTPLELDLQTDSPGIYAAVTDGTGSGPDGTSFLGKYLAFDGADATPTFINAAAGAGYVATDGSSTCTVSYGASLTSP
jgi:hypothetical protein